MAPLIKSAVAKELVNDCLLSFVKRLLECCEEGFRDYELTRLLVLTNKQSALSPNFSYLCSIFAVG